MAGNFIDSMNSNEEKFERLKNSQRDKELARGAKAVTPTKHCRPSPEASARETYSRDQARRLHNLQSLDDCTVLGEDLCGDLLGKCYLNYVHAYKYYY